MKHALPPDLSLPASRRCRHAGFTLVEVMVAAALTGVLLVATLTGVVVLQKSYSATESYATGLADQMRLLDYLALDLRRAVPPGTGLGPWALDADGQGLKVNVPDYYSFNASDPQHLFPVSNSPIYDSPTGTAYYSSTGAVSSISQVPYKVVAYRYTNGAITRYDPWQPYVPNGSGGYQDPGPIPIATTMTAFPTLVPDTTLDTSGAVLRYNITFYANFQPYVVQNATDTITLHNVTFIRSKDLAR